MQIDLDHWPLFTICVGLLLVSLCILIWQGRLFYTKDSAAIRKFSILELQMPATPEELVKLIKGIYKLPPVVTSITLRALKGQLWLNFLFMPLVYGSVFLLCWRVAQKMNTTVGYIVFTSLALVQLIPLICGIIEKIYLLKKIGPEPATSTIRQHKLYLWMEAVKWGLFLLAAVSGISVICYFWLSGDYTAGSLRFILIVIIEIIIFLLVAKNLLSYRTKKPA